MQVFIGVINYLEVQIYKKIGNCIGAKEILDAIILSLGLLQASLSLMTCTINLHPKLICEFVKIQSICLIFIYKKFLLLIFSLYLQPLLEIVSLLEICLTNV
jgi:hypothetical protein